MTLLRTLLALVVVLLAPGYLLLRALFPTGGPRDAERLALTIGSSLAVSVGAGLVLQLTSGGITGQRVDRLLGAVLLTLAALAALRTWRARSRRDVREDPIAARRLWLLRAAPLLLAAGLGVLAIAIARHGALRVSKRAAFAQLWLVPRAAGAQVGVASFEHATTRFIVTVTAGTEVIDRDAITLASGATYTHDIELSKLQSSTMPIEARLLIGTTGALYRTVSWTPTTSRR